MLTDSFIGGILMLITAGFMIYLVFWSRRTIELIRREKLKSAREILKRIHEKK